MHCIEISFGKNTVARKLLLRRTAETRTIRAKISLSISKITAVKPKYFRNIL